MTNCVLASWLAATPLYENHAFDRASMKRRLLLAALLALMAIPTVLWFRNGERCEALNVVFRMNDAIASSNRKAISDLIAAPDFLAGKTPDERGRLLLDLLSSEISAEGLAILASQGQFSPLGKLFPGDGERWARAASVNLNDCVAFKLSRNNIQAELVLFRDKDSYRILCCNNI